MKIGWLWWEYGQDDKPKLCADEPEWGHKWVQIVYTEVVSYGTEDA